MLRFGVSIYLMLATLAGPLLCPCSAPQFLSYFSALNAEETAATASCPCCPKLPNLPLSPTRNQSQDEHEPTRTIPPGQCPCQEHGHGSTALHSARIQHARQTANSLHDGLSNAPLLCWTNFHHVALALETNNAPSRRFFNPRDLLFALHILRC